MFNNFMDFGMPSMFGSSGRNSMRASARPSYRGLDAWDIFNPQPEPTHYYQPRQTVTPRQRPSYYNNYEDDQYEHLRRAPRASVGGYGKPQHYRTAPQEEEEYETEPQVQSVPTMRGTARPQQRYQQKQQPETYRQPYQSNTHVNDSEEEVHHPAAARAQRQQKPSHQHSNSSFDPFRPESVLRGSQTTRQKPEPTTFKSQFDEHVSSKIPKAAQVEAPKTNKKYAAQSENSEPNLTQKAAQNKPQQKKTQSKPVNQPTSHQVVNGKIIIKQDKGDFVVIEDVTPPRPKMNPALEPARGLLIEEVRC